jgi:hypothetical protein
MEANHYSLVVYYDCAQVTCSKNVSALLKGYIPGSYTGPGTVRKVTELALDGGDPIIVDSYSIPGGVNKSVEYQINGVSQVQPFSSLAVRENWAKRSKASVPPITATFTRSKDDILSRRDDDTSSYLISYLVDSVYWSPQISIKSGYLLLSAVIVSEEVKDLPSTVVLVDGNLNPSFNKFTSPQFSRSISKTYYSQPSSESSTYVKYDLDDCILSKGENHVDIVRSEIIISESAIVDIDGVGSQKARGAISFTAPWYIPSGDIHVYDQGHYREQKTRSDPNFYDQDLLVGIGKGSGYSSGETVVLDYRPIPGVYAMISYDQRESATGIRDVKSTNNSDLSLYYRTARLKPAGSEVITSPVLETGGYSYYPSTVRRFSD